MGRPSAAKVAVYSFDRFATTVQDGKRIAESPRWKLISEEDRYTLLIYEVRPEDAGKYDCTVSNKHGKAACSARLNVVGT